MSPVFPMSKLVSLLLITDEPVYVTPIPYEQANVTYIASIPDQFGDGFHYDELSYKGMCL